MFNLREIIKKLQPLLTKELNKRATYKDVAKALNIPYNRFKQQLFKNHIPYKELMYFCYKRKISINYLFFGQLPESLIENTTNIIVLNYNKGILGSLGDGLINYELEPLQIAIDKYLLDYLGGNYKSTEIINGYGNSMEPFISDKSLIFIDKSQTNILDKRIYALLTDGELFVKQCIKKEDILLLRSFNKKYPDIYSQGEVKIIGKVVGVLTRL